MATCSYAQIAKGQPSAKPAAPRSVSSQAASTTGSSLSRDATPATATATGEPSVAVSTTSNDDTTDTAQTTAQPETSDQVNGAQEAQAPINDENPSTKESSAGTLQTLAQEPKRSAVEAWETAEKRGKGPNSSSARSSDVSEVKKSRKPKKGRGDKEAEQEQPVEREKEKEVETPKAELAPAPIPVVNIWQQRQALHAAKSSPSSGTQQRTAPTTNGAVSSTSAVGDAKPKPSANDENDIVALQGKPAVPAKAQRKANDFGRDSNDQARRANSKAARTGEKAEKTAGESLPVVSDITSWPTPETAVAEQKTQDKAERQSEKEKDESKEESGPKEKPKWKTLPIVPTVNFKTQINRGGRAGRPNTTRGGRENGTRGSHHGAANSVDRQAIASTNNDRAQETSIGGRGGSTSVHPFKRGSVDSSAVRESRKFGGNGADMAKTSYGQTPSVRGPCCDHSQSAVLTEEQMNGKEDQTKLGQGDAIDQQLSTVGHHGAEPGSQHPKELTKESHHGGGRTEGGGRSRGGHRGRGAHAHANGQGHHQAYAPNGQPFSGRQGYGGYPGTWTAPYNGPNSGHGGRHSARHNSMSATPFYRSPNGSSSRVPQLQTNYSYEPGAVHPQTAFPGYYPEGSSVFDLVQQQIEYYFSTENLVKDVFLRKHMDSQGFVALDVLTSFPRLQQLSKDMSVIRSACETSQKIMLVVGDDSRERLRPRQNWDKWVFPRGSRHDPVNYDDGPKSFWVQERIYAPYPYQPPMAAPYGVDATGYYTATHADPQFAAYMNGGQPSGIPSAINTSGSKQGTHDDNAVNGQVATGESQLSAAVPEFSPSVHGFPGLGQSVKGKADVAGPADATPSNGEVGPLANGTHEEASPEVNPEADRADHPLTNGVNGGHEAIH